MTTFYAYPGDSDHPKPAAYWFWQTGDQWMAVTSGEDLFCWWDNDAERYSEALAESNGILVLPIAIRPTSGTLIYRQANGFEVREGALLPDVQLGVVKSHGVEVHVRLAPNGTVLVDVDTDADSTVPCAEVIVSVDDLTLFDGERKPSDQTAHTTKENS